MVFTPERSLGKGPCPNCGHDGAHYKTTIKGFVVVICPPDADGGCHAQWFARSEKSSRIAAGKVTKWSDEKLRKAILGDVPEPEPEDDPEPEPEEDDPEDDPEEVDDVEEPEPEPAPRRKMPAKIKRKLAAAKKKSFWDIEI